MALSRGLRRDLQGDRIETLVVALGVATDQRFDLCGCRHLVVSLKKVARKDLMAKRLGASQRAATKAGRTIDARRQGPIAFWRAPLGWAGVVLRNGDPDSVLANVGAL